MTDLRRDHDTAHSDPDDIAVILRQSTGVAQEKLDLERVRAALAACEGVPTELLRPGCVVLLRSSLVDLIQAVDAGSLVEARSCRGKLALARGLLAEMDAALPTLGSLRGAMKTPPAEIDLSADADAALRREIAARES